MDESPTPTPPPTPTPTATPSVRPTGRRRPRVARGGQRELPRTGANILGTAALAAGLTATGAGALREARRREEDAIATGADEGYGATWTHRNIELRSSLDEDQ